MQIVAELMQSVDAGAASLTLVNNGDTRRIVSFGPPAEDPPSSGNTCVLTSDRFVCGLALGGEHQAVLELRPAPGTKLSTEQAESTTTCAQST